MFAGGNKNNFALRAHWLLAVLVLFVSVFFPLKALAQFAPELNVDVSLGVGDTSLRVTGKGPPLAIVTILRDGSAIGTATTDANGVFDKSFPSQPPGLHNIKLFAETSDGQTTDTVTQNINLAPHTETTLTVFLPSTLNLSANQVRQGEEITFSGVTSPGSNVTLFLDNNLTYSTAADTNGRWSITVQTDGFYVGTHNAYAIAYDQSGGQSVPTSKRAFQVVPAVPGEPEPGQPPYIEPPLITKPQPNQHFSQTPIEVCGVALPNAQVEIWEDGESIGSVFANHRGDWCFKMDLYKPRHEISARTCLARACSSFSDTVTIFFDGAGTASDFRFRLGTYRYTAVSVGEPIVLELFLENGKPPYEVIIDWGGDTVERMSLDKTRSSVKFAYAAAGHYTGIATARDSNNQVQTRYFSVMVTEEKSSRWLISLIIAGLVASIGGISLYLMRRHFVKKQIHS